MAADIEGDEGAIANAGRELRTVGLCVFDLRAITAGMIYTRLRQRYPGEVNETSLIELTKQAAREADLLLEAVGQTLLIEDSEVQLKSETSPGTYYCMPCNREVPATHRELCPHRGPEQKPDPPNGDAYIDDLPF